MKRLLFILFTLLTLHSFAQQDTVYVKLRGIPGVYNMSKNAGGDSIIFYVAGVRNAISVGTVVDLSPFLRKSDTADMLLPYATKDKLKEDSIALANSMAPAFINQSFDTSTRALTLTRIDGTSQSVVIPKGTANGTSGIAALSSSRTGDTVSVMGDNGTKTTFSVNSSDSATRVHNGDNISVLNNNANYITSSGAPVQSVAGKTGAVALAKSDVGLSNVDNTSDLSKPISTATQTALNLKANDSAVVKLTGDQTISGTKNFTIVSTGTINCSSGDMFINYSGGNGGTSLGRLGKVYIASDGTLQLQSVNDAVGDFVTRNTSNGLITRRTASEVLTDIGALSKSDSTIANRVTNLQNTKEPTITAGTTSQFWSGNKTWQNVSSLPVQTAVQTALNAKLDTSFKQNLYAADPILFSNDSTITVRQSFVDSLRTASFATINFGLNKIDTSSSSMTKHLVIDNNKSLFFSGQGNLYQNTITAMNFANGGIIFETNGDGAHGSISNRPNLVLTPSGISVDGGNNIPTAKIEIKASSGAAGDAAIKIHTSPLMVIPEDAAIEKDSSGYINVTTGTVRKKLAYTSDIKNESLQYRDYTNDSVAVVDGHLNQWDYYRTGNIVKTVVTLPVFTLSYIVDYTTGANDSTQFFLAYAKNNTPFTVDWGDGNTSDFTNTADSVGVRTPTHKYTSNGTYIIKVIFSNPANIANVTTFYLNNYPYAAKVTKVVNLDKLTAATDIELNDAKSLDSMTYDFAYPSTLKTLSLSNIGIIKFTPTHNLPAGLTSIRLNNNNLTTTAVNNTLVWLDGQTFNAGAKTLNISGQAPFSPPSGAGLTAKTSLESKGWTITTD